MMLELLCGVCMTLIVLMPWMKQPLSLGLCLMLLTVMLCILFGFSVASWYAYILFLIYAGGLLVMFAYVSALIPNNAFSGYNVMLVSSMLTLFFMAIFCAMYWADSGCLGWQNVSASGILSVSSGSVLVSPSNIITVILLGVVLLFNLLAVVKICGTPKVASLRPHFSQPTKMITG